MKVLAIDSSGLVATVALLTDDVVVAEYSVNNKMTHSQTLVPMLDEIRIPEEELERAVNLVASNAAKMNSASFPVNEEVLRRIVFGPM